MCGFTLGFLLAFLTLFLSKKNTALSVPKLVFKTKKTLLFGIGLPTFRLPRYLKKFFGTYSVFCNNWFLGI
jgi:hypothetical protein